jgi:hypothetical protein
MSRYGIGAIIMFGATARMICNGPIDRGADAELSDDSGWETGRLGARRLKLGVAPNRAQPREESGIERRDMPLDRER